MRSLSILIIVYLATMGISVVHADELDGLEMDVIDAEERPEAMMRRIELPDAMERRGRGARASDSGRSTASELRERGAEIGQDTAEAARERRGPPSERGRPPDVPGAPPGGNGGEGSRPDNPFENAPGDGAPGGGEGMPPENPVEGGPNDGQDPIPDSPGGNRPDGGGQDSQPEMPENDGTQPEIELDPELPNTSDRRNGGGLLGS